MNGHILSVESSLLDYGGPTWQVPAAGQRWPDETCANCGQALGDAYYVIHGTSTYHPACARRLAAVRPTEMKTPRTAPSRQTLALLRGRACPYERWSEGLASTRSGRLSRELIEVGAFGPLKPGTIPLRVNHSRDSLPASVIFSESRAGLDFVARLYDSPVSRELVRLRSTIIGVSPKYRPVTVHHEPCLSPDYDRHRVERATLLEVSLVLQPARPAFGAATYAEIHPLLESEPN